MTEEKWSGRAARARARPLSYFTTRRRGRRKVEIPRYVSYTGRISRFDEVAEDERAAPRHFRVIHPFMTPQANNGASFRPAIDDALTSRAYSLETQARVTLAVFAQARSFNDFVHVFLIHEAH